MKSQEIIVMTGAHGFIGSNCAKLFKECGYQVRSLVRCANQAGEFKCVLPDEVDPVAFQGGVRAVIHCAYETRVSKLEQAHAVNVLGTQKILQLARKNNIPKFVFISSMAAHPEAHSFYGKSKWEIECSLDQLSDLVIRPGTVLGMGGVFERTREMIRKLPVLPVFFGKNKRMQTVWIEDLCEGIFQAVSKNLTGAFNIAEGEGVLIPDFYRGIAALDGKSPLLVPFPGHLTLFFLKAVESLGVRLPITSENLLGIKYLKSFDVSADCEKLGIKPRSFVESLKTLTQIEKN